MFTPHPPQAVPLPLKGKATRGKWDIFHERGKTDRKSESFAVSKDRARRESFDDVKHGRNPTREQKKFLKSKGLNFENWLICKDTPTEMQIEHRHTSTVRVIKKNT